MIMCVLWQINNNNNNNNNNNEHPDRNSASAHAQKLHQKCTVKLWRFILNA